MLELSQVLPLCGPLKLGVVFSMPLSLLGTSLLSDSVIYSRLLCFVCPSLEIRHFLRELWFPFVKIIFRNQNFMLGVLIVSGVSQLPATCVARGNTRTHIYFSLSVSIDSWKFKFTQVPLSLIQQHNITSSLSLPIFLTPFLDSEKLGSSYSICFLLWHLPCV